MGKKSLNNLVPLLGIISLISAPSITMLFNIANAELNLVLLAISLTSGISAVVIGEILAKKKKSNGFTLIGKLLSYFGILSSILFIGFIFLGFGSYTINFNFDILIFALFILVLILIIFGIVLFIVAKKYRNILGFGIGSLILCYLGYSFLSYFTISFMFQILAFVFGLTALILCAKCKKNNKKDISIVTANWLGFFGAVSSALYIIYYIIFYLTYIFI